MRIDGFVTIDPTERLVVVPTTINFEPKKVKWYTKLWRTIAGWDFWSAILLVLLVTLEGGLIGFLLYWFKYM